MSRKVLKVVTSVASDAVGDQIRDTVGDQVSEMAAAAVEKACDINEALDQVGASLGDAIGDNIIGDAAEAVMDGAGDILQGVVEFAAEAAGCFCIVF